MPAPVIGGAIAAAGAVGGAAMGASASKKAANKAADSAYQTAAMNNELAREFRAKNEDVFNPFIDRGNIAGDTYNALLGLGTAGSKGRTDWEAYVRGNPDALANWQAIQGTPSNTFGSLADFGQYHYNADGSRRDLAPYTVGARPASSGAQAAQDAFNTFRNSTGYQFRFNEGMNGLNALNAARGSLDSGAAVKSALQFGQNIGSQEFGNYLGYLGNQQGVGMQGAGALAGVGLNALNNMTANNNSAGSAAANAALIRGSANNQLYGSIGNALGGLASSFGGNGFLGTGYRQSQLDAGQILG